MVVGGYGVGLYGRRSTRDNAVEIVAARSPCLALCALDTYCVPD